jgi:stalled ribosome alternative rescue factor ArfA
VTDETVSDESQTEPLVQEAISKNKVERVFGDGAYDSRANFNLLASNGIDPAIKVRKNASRKAKGSYERKESVIEQQTDFEGWRAKESPWLTDVSSVTGIVGLPV